jgi:hypothetical protein
MRKLLSTTTVLLALATPAMADPLILTGPLPGHTVGPQSTSNPCIIAGTTCQQPGGFGYNLFSPNSDPAYNRYSTQDAGGGVNVADGVQGTPYNALALAIAAGGGMFSVAIDVNTTGAATERLLGFEVIDTTTNTVLYNYVGPTSIAPVNANGNGFADWTLSTINLLDGRVAATDGILFHARWDGAVDGSESFFLVNGTGGTQFGVPGPMAGAGLPGILTACFGLWAFAKRRRNKLTGDLPA